MKRLSTILAAAALTAPVAGCLDEDPLEGEEIKSDDGKADSSALGVFMDASFEGKLLIDSSWNDKQTVQDQLLYTVAGGAVGFLIGLLRVTRDAHEVITSIMLNSIVVGFSLWLGNAVLFVGGSTRGTVIAPSAELPRFGMHGSAANMALFLSLAVVGLVWWMRARTTWGRAWLAVGRSPETARSVGISVGRVQILVMTGAGALAGLAATNFVLGHKHAYEFGLGAGTGLLGISAALLGRLHPIGVVIASIVLAFLSVGGLNVGDLVPKELTEMLQGVVPLAVAAAVPWVKRKSGEVAA